MPLWAMRGEKGEHWKSCHLVHKVDLELTIKLFAFR